MISSIQANEKFRIESRNFGPFQTNIFLLIDETKNESYLFDCGFEPQSVIEWIESSKTRLKEIWLTHGHIDHSVGAEIVAAHFKVPFYMHQDDSFMLQNLAAQGQMFGVPAQNVRTPDAWILPEKTTEIAGLPVLCSHVPGHSPGSVSFYFDQLGLVISGDALFQYSIGRTDLPGGNHQQLLDSIRSKLFSLPEETLVLPGHMGVTKIGVEKKMNPFLQ